MRWKLTRSHVLPVRKPACICDDALTCKEIIHGLASAATSAANGLPHRHADRPNPIRVSKRDEAEARQHRNAGVCSLALLHEPANSGEYVVFIDADLARLLEVIGKDIDQQLRVGRRVDVSVRLSIQELEEGCRVDQVAILRTAVSRWRRRVAGIERCYVG
jgi:hypothetical protein